MSKIKSTMKKRYISDLLQQLLKNCLEIIRDYLNIKKHSNHRRRENKLLLKSLKRNNSMD